MRSSSLLSCAQIQHPFFDWLNCFKCIVQKRFKINVYFNNIEHFIRIENCIVSMRLCVCVSWHSIWITNRKITLYFSKDIEISPRDRFYFWFIFFFCFASRMKNGLSVGSGVYFSWSKLRSIKSFEWRTRTVCGRILNRVAFVRVLPERIIIEWIEKLENLLCSELICVQTYQQQRVEKREEKEEKKKTQRHYYALITKMLIRFCFFVLAAYIVSNFPQRNCTNKKRVYGFKSSRSTKKKGERERSEQMKRII